MNWLLESEKYKGGEVMSTIPAASDYLPSDDSKYLLAKARDQAEQDLVELVKKKTQEEMKKRVIKKFRVKARSYWIATDVFNNEYEPSLKKLLSNSENRELLITIYKEPLIRRLMDVSMSVFLSNVSI